MAKNSHNSETEEAPEGKGPSELIMLALGDHAEQQGLVQGDDEAEIDFAVRCIEKLGDLLVEADASIQRFESENAALRDEIKASARRLTSQKGATTKARRRIIELEQAGKPRELGPMAAVFDEAVEPGVSAAELLKAIEDADVIELAFSDGHHEVMGVPPRQVEAGGFRLQRGRLLFVDGPLEVAGPGEEGQPYSIAGAALLLDGRQVGWSPFAQALAVGAGQRVNVAGSVIFG